MREILERAMKDPKLAMTRARRSFSEERLREIFARTDGRCVLCRKPLHFEHYGKPEPEFPTAWQVDHSKALAAGGTDHLNNLNPAHASCNRLKGARLTAREARVRRGVSRPPLSTSARRRAQARGAIGGGAAGFALAFVIGSPVLLLTSIGAALGLLLDPNED